MASAAYTTAPNPQFSSNKALIAPGMADKYDVPPAGTPGRVREVCALHPCWGCTAGVENVLKYGRNMVERLKREQASPMLQLAVLPFIETSFAFPVILFPSSSHPRA